MCTVLRFILAFIVLIIVTADPSVAAQPTPAFEPVRCPVPIPAFAVVDCGYVTVPERHEAPDGKQIRLAVAILRATDPNKVSDPVLYLEGGPGGSAVWGLDAWVGHPITQQRDLILLDQRGTGFSEPGLFCWNYEYPFDVDVVDLDVYERACRDHLMRDGIDLGAYNSAQTARDIPLVVRALGLEQVNLYGISYGTRVALTAMRDAPDVIRAVVLDSPYPPQVDGFELQALYGYQQINALLERCASDPQCGAAFPDLKARFYAFLDSDAGTYADVGDGYEELTSATIVSVLFDTMYYSVAIPYIPMALDRMIAGDGTFFGEVAAGYIGPPTSGDEDDRLEEMVGLADDIAFAYSGFDDFDAYLDFLYEMDDAGRIELYRTAIDQAADDEYFELIGLYLDADTIEQAEAYMASLSDEEYFRVIDGLVSVLALGYTDVGDSDAAFNSVHCVEEIPFNSYEETEALSVDLPQAVKDGLLEGVLGQFETCSYWGVTAAGPIETQPVQSVIPTLVLAGEFDPITPPVWALEAAVGLSAAQVVIIPGAGHSVIDSGECAQSLGIAFLNNPTAALDTSCASNFTVPWVVR